MTSLWRHANFRKLWLSQTISAIGSQITFVALTLTAVLLLNASATQMGLLTAAGTLPYLALGLPAGVWVDRLPRRPLLIVADLSRALLLGAIPIAVALRLLRIEHLYIVGFLSGIFTVLFDIAEEAFLPSLVEREQLVEGNSKMVALDSVVQMTGPGVAGGLVQWLTAPMAILVDALSFVASAFLLLSMRVVESVPALHTGRHSLWAEGREGVHFVIQHALLRPLLVSSSMLQLFGGMFDALFVLFLVRELHLEPAVVGFTYAVGSASGLLGAIVGGPLIRRVGIGRIVVIAACAISLGWLAVPLAHGTSLMAFAIVASGLVVAGVGNTLYTISSVSLSQSLTPDRLLGRVNATKLCLGYGALPLGALLGGALGDKMGVRTTLLTAGIGLASAFFWVLFSPLRKQVALCPLHESH